MTELIDYSGTAYIYYPAILGSDNSLHSTILWMGDVSESDVEPAKIVSCLEHFALRPGLIPTNGFEWFGLKNDIPVVLLESAYLRRAYDKLVGTLNVIGVHSASQFDYNPHITLPSSEFRIPKFAYLGYPELCWERKTFKVY